MSTRSNTTFQTTIAQTIQRTTARRLRINGSGPSYLRLAYARSTTIRTATPAKISVTERGVLSGDARVMKAAASTITAIATSEMMRVDFEAPRRSDGGA